MPAQDRSRKLFVRSVLAATTTWATLVGAQSLALLDGQPADEEFDNTEILELTPVPQDVPIIENQSESDIGQPTHTLSIEPSITIFRQAGSASTASNTEIDSTTNPTITIVNSTDPQNNASNTILPPSPIVLQAPDPIVIVEEPVVVVQQQQFQQPQTQQQQEQTQPEAKQNKKTKKSKSGSSK
jgi:hypothetical protein